MDEPTTAVRDRLPAGLLLSRFGEGIEYDAGIWRDFLDNTGVNRPAGANQTSAHSEACGSADHPQENRRLQNNLPA
jgi:hypothetical protein